MTRGLRPPLAPVADDHLVILAERLWQAFDDIRMHEPKTRASGDEREVNALMQARLLSLIDENALWGVLVRWVGCGTGMFPSRRSQDSRRRKVEDASAILHRRCFPYVKAEYVWSNCESFMIVKIRNESSFDTMIKGNLSKDMKLHPRRYLVEARPVPVGPGSSDLACTRHRRNFVFVNQRPPNRRGTISIWHLWL